MSTLTRRSLLTTATGLCGYLVTAGGPGMVHAAAAPNVAAIFSVPVTQKWNGIVHRALLNAVIRGEINYHYVDDVGSGDYESVFRQFSEGAADLVVGDAFAHEQVSRFLSSQYPGMSYLMGSAFKSDSRFENYAVFDSYIQDASFLSGLVAAELSTNGVLGIVARFRYPGINRLINAFMDGATDARSDIRFLIDFIDSWHDPILARQQAQAQIEGGADIIYADAPGAEQVAAEADVPAIGSLSDRYAGSTSPLVTSAQWHFEPTITAAIRKLRSGSFSAADYGIYSHMGHSGCSLAPIGAYASRIPEAGLERVAWREGQIRSLKFAAGINDADPELRLHVESEDSNDG